MKTLRDPSIPIMNRKDYFFKHSEPYLDYFNKKEFQRDFLFVSTLLSSSVEKVDDEESDKEVDDIEKINETKYKDIYVKNENLDGTRVMLPL